MVSTLGGKEVLTEGKEEQKKGIEKRKQRKGKKGKILERGGSVNRRKRRNRKREKEG